MELVASPIKQDMKNIPRKKAFKGFKSIRKPTSKASTGNSTSAKSENPFDRFNNSKKKFQVLNRRDKGENRDVGRAKAKVNGSIISIGCIYIHFVCLGFRGSTTSLAG